MDNNKNNSQLSILNYQLKKGYKKTEIGVIPKEWEVVKLNEILKIRHGKSQKEIEVLNGKYPILGTGGEMGRTNSFLYNKPSVLIGRKGTIDKPKFMNSPFWTVDTLFYSEIFKNAEPIYIYYNFLLVDWYSHNEASGVPSLNASKIEQIKIPLPPLPEQKAIATVLSDTDNLIQTLEKKIAKKQRIKKGAMQKLLAPKEGWVTKRLGDIAEIKTGSKNNQDKVADGKYPFFVRSQTVERINSFTYDCEAILIPGEGGIGSIYHYINGKFDVHQRVYKISDFDKNVSGKLIYLYMMEYFSHHAMRNSVKATVDSLRLPTFLEFEITIPKSLQEQTRIAQILSDMDAEIEALQRKLAKYKQLKQGLMQVLLTGKIRLA